MMNPGLLNAQCVRQGCQVFPGQVLVKASVGSTQDWAKRLVGDLPIALAANHQTDGHGQHGHHFYSPADTGLYFSLVLKAPAGGQRHPGRLTIGMAVAIGRVLARFYPGETFTYKWVNDIFCRQHKVCGILTEIEPANPSTALIIGVGINLTTTSFPTAISQRAGAISDDNSVDRNRLLAALLDALTDLTRHFQGPQLMKDYRRHSLLLGKEVVVNQGHQRWTGLATAIDDEGRLVITTAGRRHVFSSGEVTKVRLQKHH